MTPLTRTSAFVFIAALFIAPEAGWAQGTDTYFEFLMARRLEADGDAKGAQAALERAAAADPKSAEIRAEIAGLHLRRNERPEAEKAARAALAIDDKNVEANRALGLIFAAAAESNDRTPNPQAANNVREAITYLERAAAGTTVTADATLYYTLGRLYVRNGEADKAVASLSKVLSQNPNSVQGRLALAQAYAAAKDLKSAIATLDEILEDEPRVASALAQYQEDAGLLIDAAASYTLALAVQPTSRELKIRRIAVLLEAKEYQAALLDLPAMRASSILKIHASRACRVAHCSMPVIEAAGSPVLESSVKSFPKDTATMFTLADVYADAGRSTDAERMLRQLLATEPANANALNYLGYLLAVRGDQLDEAIRLVRRALDAEPENGAFLDSLGWAYYRKGDLAESEKYLVAAAAKLPANSEVQDHLGDLHARRGRLSDAIAAWTRALKGDGQDVEKSAIEKKNQ